MNITFDGAENIVRTHSNVGMETTVYRGSEGTGKVQTENYALDISGTVMDNSAYAGHGRTAEEVMQEAGSQDITARRNYMAVMSNSMSDEDFAKLQEDGFHPGSTDIETVVTIVDQIKAALLKGGTEVVGYTDTLGQEELESITGSKAFARELQKKFAQYDLPLTEENIEAVTDAFRTMEEIPELSEGSLKYMIENDKEPTVDNLYLARFAGAKDSSRQGQGYYAAGTVAGYYAKKPEQIDYEQLMPQIEKVIEEAGFSADNETIQNAKWLIEKGIPLNESTFVRMQQLTELKFPVTEKEFLQAATVALADGSTPAKADISKKESFLEQAVSIEQKVQELDERDADVIVVRNLPFNLKNLFAIHEELKGSNAAFEKNTAGNEGENLKGRRLLEEVRLSMTVSANLRLLKSGYRIETAAMEELIDRLKATEESISKALVQETDAGKAKEKSSLYQQTLYTLQSIKTAPAIVAAEVSAEDTLPQVDAKGKVLEAKYKNAGESYEALMTAPRKDMGDSIKKAFRNVDDILTDLDKEISEANRKTVRILGYNSMEMTEENFEKIRQSQEILSDVMEKMKPGTVLSMIREGVNPLTMSLNELDQYLERLSDNTEQELESYSKFLYKLEQKKGISPEERSAYVGIYRLLRQIEKGDDAALGAVVKGAVAETLENLLTAVRTGKKKHMDYQVTDSFGGVKARQTDAESIVEQINKGFLKTKEDLEAVLEDADTQAAEAEYEHTLYEDIRNAAGSEEAVLRHLMNYDQPVTADYLLAAGEMLKGSGETFRKLRDIAKKQGEEGRSEESDRLSKLTEKITDRESTLKACEELADEWLKDIEDQAFEEENSSLDIRSMSSLYKQITFMKSMAREENYVMPVEIDGELTAVNLKMIHKNGEESKVSITFETQALGRNAAEFVFTEKGLSGYSVCSSRQENRLLSENNNVLKELLERENIESGDIHFIMSEDLNLKEYSLKISRDRIPGQASDTLYRAAKAYIGFVQEMSRKGSMEL
ncbi:MAG: DUF6240 domain-containing protein [Suilimivivens sp.]